MTLASLRGALVRQFGCPRGVLGALAGLIMAARPSNRERSLRTLELLDIRPDDRVLEVGFGPGIAIARAAELAHRGKVVGVDHSGTMLRQASWRNAKAIAAGGVELHLASVEGMPAFGAPFDRAFGVNVHMFWADCLQALARIAALLKPGARLAITFQPRKPGAIDQDAVSTGERIARDMRAAGFESIRSELLAIRPVAAICVLGRKPPRQHGTP